MNEILRRSSQVLIGLTPCPRLFSSTHVENKPSKTYTYLERKKAVLGDMRIPIQRACEVWTAFGEDVYM